MCIIEEIKKAKESLLKDYQYISSRSFEMSRLKMDLRLEVELQSNYRGREIFEMLQNADDANAPEVRISWNDGEVTITNNGGDFTASGYQSIMMPYSSTKIGEEGKKKIGYKGLGFRSVLNWTDAVEIQSGEVLVSFSKNNAGEIWNELKNAYPEPFRNRLEDYAKNDCRRDVPVPYLSIPEKVESVKADVTSIRLKVKPSLQADIQRQIKGLNPHVLLFLKNVKRIDLSGRILEIERKTINDNGYLVVTLMDGSEKEEWIVLHREGNNSFGEGERTTVGQYGLDIAVPFGNTSYSGGPVYSFFPTQIMLDLPCIINGTFELDSSRNNITSPYEANDFLMETIGEAMGEMSLFLVEHDNYRQDEWTPYGLLNMKPTQVPSLRTLQARLKEQRQEKAVLPTAGRCFKDLKSTFALSEQLAVYLRNHFFQSCLEDHLAPGYSGIVQEVPPTKDSIENDFESYASACKDAASLAGLIWALYHSGFQPEKDYFYVLKDDAGNVINKEKAYFAAGDRFDDLPGFIPIQYVWKDLQEELIRIRYGSERLENPARELRDRLLEMKVNVSVADLSAVKNSIASWSKNIKTIPDERYSQLIKSLYKTFEKKETEASSVDLKAFGPEMHLHLRAMDKAFQEATALVLPTAGKDDRWTIYWDDRWCAELNVDKKQLEDFFVEKLGVSRKVPVKYVSFADDVEYLKPLLDKARPAEQFTSKKVGEDSNCAFVMIPDFFRGENNPFVLIAQDERCRTELTRNMMDVAFLQKSIKHLSLPYSYMSYCWKRDNNTYKNCILSQLSEMEMAAFSFPTGMESSYCKTILLALGARNSYEDLTAKELYDRLRIVRPDPKGVMREYQLIRRALETKMIPDDERMRYLDGLEVFATKDNSVSVFHHDKVFYWDNDRFPASILSQLPKLYIGNRVGADSVSKVFGVHRLDDLKIMVSGDGPECSGLEKELEAWLTDRKPYLLAVRYKNLNEDANLSLRNALQRLTFKVFEGVKIQCDQLSVSGEIPLFGMAVGQDSVFYLRCPKGRPLASTVEASLNHGIDFWENVAEAVCIALKVRGDEAMSSFRTILKGSKAENEILRKKEIPDDIWADTLKALGMSEEERRFWLSLSDDDKWIDSLENPLRRAMKIKEYFGFDGFAQKYADRRMPEIAEMLDREVVFEFVSHLFGNNPIVLQKKPVQMVLEANYFRKLCEIRDEIDGLYCRWLYSELWNKPSEHARYLSRCAQFRNDDAAIRQLAVRFSSELKGKDDLRNVFLAKLGIDGDGDYRALPDNPLSEYSELIKNVEIVYLPDEVRSLLLFKGHGNEIGEKIAALHTSEDEDEMDLEATFEFGTFHSVLSPGNGTPEGGSGGYVSEKAKLKAGRRAEKIVKEYLQQKLEGVSEVKPWSRNSNLVGDDRKHYDYSYKLEGKLRLLEVKAMSGSRILMSKGEYEFARKEEIRDIYDLAIVSRDESDPESKHYKITIWQNPFKDGLLGDPHTYEFNLAPDIV